eukprot:CAMPEP_0116882048 /NCGR_PEP_ID=MMETSP0463-20121206/14188_1 /TAXON_ID=181622 /ORGANISM="Strombidinopsis sp, Strain SopsisLIS2011" /LENGTH=62 /DNA_ID=CAMNT_0004534659 /DNA_START=666 /DNA_END=854 /DNA_ORIENTATION=+
MTKWSEKVDNQVLIKKVEDQREDFKAKKKKYVKPNIEEFGLPKKFVPPTTFMEKRLAKEALY